MQEPGSNAEIKEFCKSSFNVAFQMFAKTDVLGENAHPLYAFLTEAQPFRGFPDTLQAKFLAKALKKAMPDNWEGDSVKWNFCKFLVDREGNVVGRFEPMVPPEKLEPEIEKYL